MSSRSTTLHPIIGQKAGVMSPHGRGGVPAHTPLAQTSLVVQELSSSHAFVLFTCVHPVAGLQPSSVHSLSSSQSTGVLRGVPAQTPETHTSLMVQALPSSQDSGVTGGEPGM